MMNTEDKQKLKEVLNKTKYTQSELDSIMTAELDVFVLEDG